MIRIRRGSGADIDGIMACYAKAKQYMRESGNRSQWVNGYPSREIICDDIASGNNYLGIDNEGEIAVVFAFIIGEDPTYEVIEDGHWLNDLPYGTIHRIASSGKYGGMLKTCVEFCMTKTDNIRLDTHSVNTTMQRAAERLGFIPCGTIICCDGTPRIAYHKVVDRSLP